MIVVQFCAETTFSNKLIKENKLWKKITLQFNNYNEPLHMFKLTVSRHGL